MKNTFPKPELNSDVHIFTTVSPENASGNQILSESHQGSIFEKFGVILEELEAN